MRKIYYFFFLFVIASQLTSAQSYKILESNSHRIKVEFNFGGVYQLKDTTIDSHVYQKIIGGETYFRNPGEPWVPDYLVNIGIPFNSKPTMKIINVDKTTLGNKIILPYPEDDPQNKKLDVSKFDKLIYSTSKPFPEKVALFGTDFTMRYSRVIPLHVSPFQYNPVSHQLITNKKVVVLINYNQKSSNRLLLSDNFTNGFLKSGVINYSQSIQWTGKEPATIVYGGTGYGNYWYNPDKNYFKIYLKNKGVYRITFEQLVAAGVPIQGGVQSDKLEIVNEGNTIPIDVVDGGDGLFNSGDYFQFVGGPPSPTPYSRLNIYNNTNVYWFSYQSDTLAARYNNVDGYPNVYQTTIQSTLESIHYEKDSLYEPLGHSHTDNIDHWYWDRITGDHGTPTHIFNAFFPSPFNFDFDQHYMKVRVNVTGMNSFSCSPDNHLRFKFNNYTMGDLSWNNQTDTTFEKTLYISQDSVHLFPDSNYIQIRTVESASCDTTNECRMNWYDLQFYRYNKTNENNFNCISPPGLSGIVRFWTWNWTRDNMKIYIPEKNKMITNPQIVNDSYKSAFFVDTISAQYHYYCVASDYFLSPDSIIKDVASDLRSPTNGADYIIITHPDFINAAQRLKNLRSVQYPDSEITNPRIQIVDINQIYDEFSYGLLNPWALRDFVKYAFENWQSPAPVYIVLFGDMSHDYRQLLTTSRPNFIPSLPFYADLYGEAPSDNLIVDVAGNDFHPDLVIGRMSCETVEEADILMDKLENYPEDNSKAWKQDVLLASSGLYLEDEMQMHFNEANNRLANLFLIPNGIHPSRVYNFPLNAADSMFMGGGPRIREEIDEGVVLGNYYGHGGGGQWDLIFTNDDIALLQNDGRLPVIFSVTCYTAHFDDQDVFGEKFNKLPDRGSIGFFGNTVLTYWGIGNAIDEKIFAEIFNNRDYIIGKAIFNAKNQVQGGLYDQQITLLTYLGDPGLRLALPDKPDFVIKSSDITISEENPLVNDTIQVKAKIANLGVVFPGDTINVQVFASSADTSYLVGTSRLPSFGEEDSIVVDWIPTETALYNIKVEVNELDPIPEEDHSDNIATSSFVVYNVSEANVLYPQDGYSTEDSTIKFKFIDIGHYINLDLTYYIEIDTSLSFSSPLIASGPLHPEDGFLNWISPQLPLGSYFWRVRIYEGGTYGEWSKIRSFSILSDAKSGFYSFGKELQLFNTYNVNYSDSANSLRLNTSILPPRPTKTTFIDDILLDTPVVDTVGLTAITTDGTYIYFANMWYYASGKSKIYKIGTGYNGTVKGQYYGVVPTFYDIVANSITYHSDGFIYVTTPDPYHLIKVNPQTGDTSSVFIPDGLLNAETGRPTSGIFYVKSDGQYFYNLTLADSMGNKRYVLRIFDPANGWQLKRPDMELQSSSFEDFSDFFVADGYLYPTEVYYHNLMRRIRISDGYFEDEWAVYTPWQSYYSWCYDWDHDIEIASVFDRHNWGFSPKFSRFEGRHIDANGTFTTQEIGPASNWKSLNYDLHLNSTGTFSNILYGLNKTTKNYDTLATDIPENYSLQNISASDYKYLTLFFSMTDTTFNLTNPMQFKSLNVDYDGLPEIMITKNDLNVSPDSVLQGLNTSMHFTVKNVGFVPADNIALKFYLNDLDSTFYISTANLKPDSSKSLDYTISTTPLIFDNTIKAIAEYPNSEYFTFNNIMSHTFYVVRDSIKPDLNITFDGKEILDGDIVSSRPEIKITLNDNSPLSLDTSLFTVIFDNIPLDFSRNDVKFDTIGYPHSEAILTWKTSNPFPDGKHSLEVLAKDPSGNFSDTTSYRITFYVFTEYDLKEVYNYPNPFKDGTYFTFIVTGDKIPDQLYIKIYTVAGRLIKTINISSAELGTDLGFKRIFWNGKDEDGDEIANGVYFYKMIYKVKDVVKTVTQKLAKVK